MTGVHSDIQPAAKESWARSRAGLRAMVARAPTAVRSRETLTGRRFEAAKVAEG